MHRRQFLVALLGAGAAAGAIIAATAEAEAAIPVTELTAGPATAEAVPEPAFLLGRSLHRMRRRAAWRRRQRRRYRRRRW